MGLDNMCNVGNFCIVEIFVVLGVRVFSIYIYSIDNMIYKSSMIYVVVMIWGRRLCILFISVCCRCVGTSSGSIRYGVG